MTITAEQVQWLANGNPPSSDRDHAEWITDLAAALIASDAARKLAEERLVRLKAALRVNMLRLDPSISHDAIDAMIEAVDND